MKLDDLVGTATIPYPDVFFRESKRFRQWRTMEGELLAFIDIAATSGPYFMSGGPRWHWILLPWAADQQRYDDTKGMNAFDGSVSVLTAWLRDAGALEPVPADTAAALLARSTWFGTIGYDTHPLEEQFLRIIPTKMLAVYPRLAALDGPGGNPWRQYATGAA